MCGAKHHLQHTWSIVAVEMALFCQIKMQHMTNNDYAKSFNTHITMLNIYDWGVAQHTILVTKIPSSKGLCSPMPEEKVTA